MYIIAYQFVKCYLSRIKSISYRARKAGGWSQIGQMGQIEIHGSNSFTCHICQHHTRHQFWSTLKRRKIPRSGDWGWGVKENKENLMYISFDAQDVSLWISIDPF